MAEFLYQTFKASSIFPFEATCKDEVRLNVFNRKKERPRERLGSLVNKRDQIFCELVELANILREIGDKVWEFW